MKTQTYNIKSILVGVVVLTIGLTSNAVIKLNNLNHKYSVIANNGDEDKVENEAEAKTAETTDKFVLYPKVSQRMFVVEFEKAFQDVKYTIFNEYGEIVQREEVYLNSAIQPINISSLDKGTYYIELTSENKETVQKFVKK